MYQVLIVIHTLVTLALIGIILVQRSSSDGMGMVGGSSNSFMSGRAAATFVTRATAALAAVFILLSLGIGILTAHNHAGASTSIMDKMTGKPESQQAPAQPPAKPAAPSVPRPE
jgi:preprotein translocase subunit SecG